MIVVRKMRCVYGVPIYENPYTGKLDLESNPVVRFYGRDSSCNADFPGFVQLVGEKSAQSLRNGLKSGKIYVSVAREYPRVIQR